MRISAPLVFFDVDLHAELRVFALEPEEPRLLGRAVVHRARRSGLVHALDSALERRPAEVVLAHDLQCRLPAVVERDDLALELLREASGGTSDPVRAPLLRRILGLSLEYSIEYSHINIEAFGRGAKRGSRTARGSSRSCGMRSIRDFKKRLR